MFFFLDRATWIFQETLQSCLFQVPQAEGAEVEGGEASDAEEVAFQGGAICPQWASRLQT